MWQTLPAQDLSPFGQAAAFIVSSDLFLTLCDLFVYLFISRALETLTDFLVLADAHGYQSFCMTWPNTITSHRESSLSSILF